MVGQRQKIATITTTLFLLAFNASAAYAQQVTPEVMEAACRAQNHLQMNGYLNPIESFDENTLHIDIFDRMMIDGSNESIEELLEERQGSYSNKLYGVNIGGKYNAVAYIFSSHDTNDNSHYFKCVMMEKDGDWISLIHQDCRVENLTRISESDLDC